jgi:hypothetical protein
LGWSDDTGAYSACPDRQRTTVGPRFFSLLGTGVCGPPALAGDQVVVARAGRLVALDPAGGERTLLRHGRIPLSSTGRCEPVCGLESGAGQNFELSDRAGVHCTRRCG